MKLMVMNIWNENKLAFILAAAFLLRISYALTSNIPITSDSLDYYTIATNLLNGNGFALSSGETAYRLPAYPYFLSLLWYINPSVLFVQIVQTILDTFSCYFIFRIGSLFNERTGLISSLLWGIFPSAIILSSMLLTETLFTTLLLFIILKTFKQQLSKFEAVVLGIVCAIAILLKPHIVLILLSIFVWRIATKEHRRQEYINGVIIVIIILLSISPWMIRNHSLFGTYSLSTNSGVNFWIGNNPSATGGYYFKDGNEVDQEFTEVNKSKKGYELAFQFIQNEPLNALAILPKKVAHLLSSQNFLFILTHQSNEHLSYREMIQRRSLFDLFHHNLLFIGSILVGTAGLIHMIHHKKSIAILLMTFIGLWILFHLIYFGGARFFFPMLPLFFIGTGYFLSYRSSASFSTMGKITWILFCGGFLSIIIAEMILTF